MVIDGRNGVKSGKSRPWEERLVRTYLRSEARGVKSVRSRPSSVVPEHGPVLRKSKERFFVPTLRVQVVRFWLRTEYIEEPKRDPV